MKRILPAIVLIAVGACILSKLLHTPTTKAGSNYSVYLPLIANGAAGDQPTPQPTPQPVDPAQLKAEVIAAVNAERQNAGCALVTENADLGNGAQAWTDYMVANNIYNHSDTVDIDWYLHHGYTRTDWLYENIAAGPRTGADVVAVWMSDEGHKATILAGCTNTTHAFDVGIGFTNYRWALAIGELHN
jgi:uncharacterized protein YkwD